MGPHRRKRVRFQLEGALGGEPDRAEDPHRVLAHADVGVADGPDEARAQVVLSPHVVDDPAVIHVVEEAVDGEIAAAGVLLRAPEDVVVTDEQVLRQVLQLVERIGAEGRYLDDLAAAEEDVRQPEPAPDQTRVAKGVLDLARVRAGRDVEILGADPEEEVADTAADQVRLVLGAAQPPDDLHGVRIEELLGDFGRRLGAWRDAMRFCRQSQRT